MLPLAFFALAFQMVCATKSASFHVRRANNVESTPQPSTDLPPLFFMDRFRRHLPPPQQSSSSHQMPALLDDPQLPDVPPALQGIEEDCLFWQYIQAKPLTHHRVQEQIQELCVNNATSNPQSQNGWCEIDLEVVIREINNEAGGADAALRMDSAISESVKQLHIYIHFTQSGLWQVLAIPDCPRREQDSKRFVRSMLFNHKF